MDNEQIKDKHITIENCDFHNKKSWINSPRSIEACNRCGIIPKEWYYIDQEKYIDQHWEWRNSSKEIQAYRFQHFEKLRADSIEIVKKERLKIIKENENSFISKSKHSNISSGTTTIDSKMEKLLQEEKNMIERIKKKQKLEIQFWIETQVKQELLKKANEDKEKRIIENELRTKEEIRKRQLENEELRRQKEIIRKKEVQRQFEEKINKIRLKHEREEKKLKEWYELECKRKEEWQKKHKEDMEKLMNNKSTWDIFNMNQEEILNKKRWLAEQKEREHQENLDKLKRERLKQSEWKQQEMEKKWNRSRWEVEKSFERARSFIENKHKQNEKRWEEFYHFREEALNQQREHNLQRRQDILYSLKRLEKEKEEKNKKYFERQDKWEQSVFLKEIEKSENIRSCSQKSKEHFEKCLGTRGELEQQFNLKKVQLLNRMDEISKRVKEKKIKEEKEGIQKLEESNAAQFEKDIYWERIKRIKEYRHKWKWNEIEEKDKKVEEYKEEKVKIVRTKREMAQSVLKQKEEVIQKFNKIIQDKKEVNAEIIKELFPEDEEFYNKIKEMIERSKNSSMAYTNHNSQGNANSSSTQSVNASRWSARKVRVDKDIEKKVEEFRNRLREDLNKLIVEEKSKEDKRIQDYENAGDSSEKQRIERKNAKERVEGNERVINMQNEIEKKLRNTRRSCKKKLY